MRTKSNYALACAVLLTTVAAAHMSDTCETVSVNGGVRVNKSDYDADQAEGGAKAFKLDSARKQADNVDPAAGVPVDLPDGTTTPPAPSAPIPNSADGQPNPGVVATPTVASPGEMLVSKGGTANKPKWFVVSDKGEAITGDALVDVMIDAKGYDSEVAAWDAIKAVKEARPH